MKDNWLYRSIMGTDEPTPAPPAPPRIPILDDPQPLSVTQRSPETERLIQRFQTESAIAAVCGSEVLTFLKNSSWQPASPRVRSEPSTSTYSSSFPDLPAPVADPRLPQCECRCQMCRSGGCKNCLANPRCEFSGISVLDDLIPVDSKEQEKLVQAASAAQKTRIAKNRILKHRSGLAPLVAKFKSDLRPYSARVPDKLFERVLDSAADYVAANVAATT